MADWMEWLEGIASAGTGIAKGLDAGMAPLNTWEGIRTKDLANDRYEYGNQDVEYEQRARMGEDVPSYYGDERDSIQSGFRKTSSGNENDIFGNEQKLALQQYLADPNGAFRQGIDATGWTPGSPEYREWLAEAINQFDPTGSIAQYDKMNIPAMQQENSNNQASMTYLQNWVRQNGADPNAEVVRFEDGTIGVRDSKTGDLRSIDEIPGGGNALVRYAAMTDAKTPYAAISGAVKDETAVQTANVNYYKAMQEGKITPAAAFKYYQDERIGADKAVQSTLSELNTLRKVDVNSLDPEAKAVHVAQVEQKTQDLAAARQRAAQHAQLAQQVLNSPEMQRGVPGNNRGQASVNTARFNEAGTNPNANAAARNRPAAAANAPVAKVPIDETLKAAAGAQKRPSYVDRRNQARVVRGQIQQQPGAVNEAFGIPQQQQPGGTPAQKAQQLITTLQGMGLPPEVITRMLQAMAGGQGG